MAESTDQELKGRFGAELEPDVLTELQSIMRLHSIDVEELWYKWESYSMKMSSDDMKLNIDTARALKKDVQDSLERESRNKAHVLNSNKRGGATPRNVQSNGDVFGMYGKPSITHLHMLIETGWMPLRLILQELDLQIE
jgi:DNA polymerase alpha subunit B